MSAPLAPLPQQPNALAAMRRISPQRRLLAGAVFLGIVGLIGAATKFGNGPTFVPLFRNLQVENVGEITDALTKANIPYELGPGGTEVRVYPADAPKARVLLAKDGMPNIGKPGLELFDKPTWGMTDFTQRVTYRRALEGELARTIGEIRGVEKARVHLALPEASPLRRLERPAEAAVVLTLRGSGTLSADQIQGIAYIVSNSVEQLPSENVAVMDDNGHILSAPADAGMAGLTSRQIDMQRTVEQQLQQKAEEMLATVVGRGNARVQVAATLNFDQAERTTEAYDPEKQVLQTEQRSESGADSASGTGAQTVVSNQYQNSKTVERVIGSIGTVKKMTVAVLVDEAAISKEAAKIGATQDTQLAALEAAVRNGLGVDSARGDRMTITAMPFEQTSKEALKGLVADSTTQKQDVLVLVDRFSKPGLILVGLIVALVLGLKLLKPTVPQGGTAGGALARGDMGSGRLDGSVVTGDLTNAVATAALAAGGSAQLAAPQTSESRALREAVAAEAASETETVAQVVRAWLGER